jgi:hypothetical protein
MIEDRLFPEGTVPEWTKPEWHAKRERAPHVDQPGHRPRLRAAAQMVHLVWEPEMTVVDLGAGDGGLLSLLDRVPVDRKWGYDLTPENVAGAQQRGQNVILGDCVDGVIEWGDVAVATGDAGAPGRPSRVSCARSPITAGFWWRRARGRRPSETITNTTPGRGMSLGTQSCWRRTAGLSSAMSA